VLWIVGTLAALGAVLAFASARHSTVALLYEDSGSGCRTLTAASSVQLARALVPVRILVGVWVASSGILAVARVARSEAAARRRAAMAGAIVAVALAGANQAFIGTDALSALVPLALLWLGVAAAVVGVGVAAMIRRREPAASWLAYVGWLAVSGLALPLMLLRLTDDGAIRSC
jgi:hypothetical protein